MKLLLVEKSTRVGWECRFRLIHLLEWESMRFSGTTSLCSFTLNLMDVSITLRPSLPAFMILTCSCVALITLGFATISGVRLGVGFNSSVRTPNIDQITSFPFVNDHSVSGA